MSVFTNQFCEACGGPGTVLSSDGWNLCMPHFVTARPSRKHFDRVTGEPIPAPPGAPADEPLSALGLRVPPAPEVVVQPADPIPGVHAFGCLSFRPGHRVHWVQGLRSANERDGHESCHVVAASEDGWFTLEMIHSGERRRVWHHSPEVIVARTGRVLSFNEKWQTLRGGGSVISIGFKASPCVHEEATGPLHERLETHGGFSISGPEALRLIGGGDGSGAST